MSFYQTYLQSDHWKQFSAETKEAAGNRCQVCNSIIGLDVHHRSYSNLWRETSDDVVCLCHACHEIYHFTDVEFTDEPLPPVIIYSGKSDSAWGTA